MTHKALTQGPLRCISARGNKRDRLHTIIYEHFGYSSVLHNSCRHPHVRNATAITFFLNINKF